MKKLKIPVVTVMSLIILISLLAFTYITLNRTILEQNVYAKAQPMIDEAATQIGQIVSISKKGQVKTDCSYDLKSKITSCYTTQDVVLNEQQGDVKAQLATFNQAMTDTGWDSEGNEIFFEQFNQIFLEPLPHQGWRALIELGYLRYTKKVEGKEIIATVNLSSKKDIKYSDYYGEDNSDARKAVADGRYYPHVSLINSQYLQGNKFY